LKKSGQGARALTDFVKIEKGLGPEWRIAVVRFDRGIAESNGPSSYWLIVSYPSPRIALDIGFSDTSTFTAAFHRLTGQTSTSDRRNLD
jgi:AraC-like DNA-binding protein